jgi:hypothetical protein
MATTFELPGRVGKLQPTTLPFVTDHHVVSTAEDEEAGAEQEISIFSLFFVPLFISE